MLNKQSLVRIVEGLPELMAFLFFPQIDASCLTWEGQQFQGKAAIVEKLTVSL